MKKVLSILLLLPMVAGLAVYAYQPKVSASDVELLSSPWHITSSGGSVEKYQQVNPNVLVGKSSVQITYNLHGTCVLNGDASAIIFDQNVWKYESLANYGHNCLNGVQTITIPLSSFGLTTSSPLTGYLHSRFWYGTAYTIDITSVKLIAGSNTSPSSVILGSTATPESTPTTDPGQVLRQAQDKFDSEQSRTARMTITPTPAFQQSFGQTPTPTPTATPTPTQAVLTNTHQTWAIQSIDAMKDTKDAICGPRPLDWINNWLDKAVELGANYVAISTPYENPSCGDALSYTRTWVKAIRAHGMHVWHRHMPLSFEGIYSVTKTSGNNYLSLISNYIKNNPDLFENGDIFTPIPEPQNGGIQGITYCANSICQFSSAASFNQWLRDAMTAAKNAEGSIGKNMKIGYFGFDGFVAWGDQNPDWHGILEDATVQQMGNITIDHYPETVNETMDQSLTALQAKYPTTPIVIGEWGTVNGINVDQEVMDTMGAAKSHGVVGFNYWQFGPSGSGEQLINTDFSQRSSFGKVQSFYKPN